MKILEFKKQLIEEMIKRGILPVKTRVDRHMASANNLNEEKRDEILKNIQGEE